MLEKKARFKHLLGNRLREKRNQKGLTIETVAEHADTGTDHLGRIERGVRQPSAYTFAKLCNYLGLDPNVIQEIMTELEKNKSG